MKTLLDTNVLVWFAVEPQKIGKHAKELMSQSESLYVSSISTFEIVIKTMNGRLKFPSNVDEVVSALSGQYLAMQPNHVQAVKEFPELTSHDPFDRMLLAQAKAEGLTLLTADKVLLDLGLGYVVDATI